MSGEWVSRSERWRSKSSILMWTPEYIFWVQHRHVRINIVCAYEHMHADTTQLTHARHHPTHSAQSM